MTLGVRGRGRDGGFESVIGLEVHLALKTRSKLFCACSADTFGEAPNSHVCAVCLGLPGALPVANRAALELAATFALALGCRLPATTQFHRKHYFYPDAPKNYQISQFDQPVGEHGAVELGGRRIGITRCHLEEDAGRLLHPLYADHSLVDLNRAGAPLLEMVTEPDLRTPAQARDFLEHIRLLAQSLGVSDAAPEQGKMRADVNVSVRRPGDGLGTKVEIKNLNSFKSVQTAIALEVRRQVLLLEAGQAIEQETRGWNEGGQKTYLLRTKEGSADYRYLADPDLPPMHLSGAWIEARRAALAELPDARRARYLALGVRAAEAELIVADVAQARLFDDLVAAAGGAGDPSAQTIATWLTGEVAGAMNASAGALSPERLDVRALLALIAAVDAGVITATSGKALLGEVLAGADPRALIEERGLRQISDAHALGVLVDDVLAAHPTVVASLGDNPKALNALVGQVMRASGGQARAEAVRAILAERLGLEG
jgi:aspartyl-tRNA(Asn)/glutamyl-tRNA(Gln) amidotransferase subunit B